jgi:CO/xanthine dehydrogenase FAD-binding subunit
VSFDQPASGYPLVAAAAVVAKAKGVVSHAVLGFTGLSENAFLSASVGLLVGTRGTAADIDSVADAAAGGVEPNADIHASGDYRLHLARARRPRAHQALGRAVVQVRVEFTGTQSVAAPIKTVWDRLLDAVVRRAPGSRRSSRSMTRTTR